MAIAYIGVGSNIGDKIGYIQQAHSLLNFTEGIDILESSSLYETEPVGNKNQEWFVNAVLKAYTKFSPEELLFQCHKVEKKLGRIRTPDSPRNNPRTIDLDILFYDNIDLSNEFLQIPHPRVHERAFMLVPMLELDENLVHPVLHKTIFELHDDLEEPEEVYLYGTRRIDF